MCMRKTSSRAAGTTISRRPRPPQRVRQTRSLIAAAVVVFAAAGTFAGANAQQRVTATAPQELPAADPAGVVAATALAAPGDSPRLGEPATPEAIEGWDIGVGPSGENLPPGSGTPAEGEQVYTTKCIACHGVEGAGGPNDVLVGGHGTLRDAAPLRTIGSYWPYATTLFDYVRRAMPYTQPLSLTDDEAYAVTAYLLELNGVIGKDDVMNAETLPQVAMPNRDSFESAWPDWKQ